MSVDVQIAPDLVLSGKAEIHLLDKTGIYSAINAGGWGTPNANRSTVSVVDQECNLYITFPFQTEESAPIENFSIAPYEFLITYDRMVLLPYALYGNAGAVIEDGLWTFRLPFVVDSVEYEETTTWFNTATIREAISKYGANLPTYDTGRNAKYAEMLKYVNGAQDAYDTNFLDRAEDLLQKAITLVANNC